jgi:hypothetical protein
MGELTEADMIWNRACGEDPLRSLPGDRALADLLRAHGLVMNGGVLHAVEILTPTELSDAESGYRFYGLDGVASLLSRARKLFETGDDLERHERLCPADRVLDSRSPMSSERRASSWPTANRAIRAKNNIGDA